MARPKNTTQRRAQIVEGLLVAMAFQGYDATSVKDIAAAAGLSPGLLHYHFGNKQAILLALIETLGGRLEDRLAGAMGRAGTPRERLNGVIDAMLSVQSKDSPELETVAAWVAVAAEAARRPEVAEAFALQMAALRRLLGALIIEVLADEEREVGKADELAVALLGAIQGCFSLSTCLPLPEGFAAPRVREMAAGLIDAQPLAAQEG